ncbi:uncharacterized protein M6B38_301700 [Iris pallida]|uniref:NADH dehydrogenase subunit 6 n=1 Tax=Iris pallida TaxID=29817 RepID=A0AAX6HN68_IRIPA|nr:uncharacterized protein M6B38_301700 [Iris pallida]
MEEVRFWVFFAVFWGTMAVVVWAEKAEVMLVVVVLMVVVVVVNR